MTKKWFQFPIEYLWVVTVLVGIFAFVNTHPIRPQDFWFHLAVGKIILANGQIPTVDTFSHTAAGMAYASYQNFWLMDIVMYKIYQWGGAALTVFLHSLTITGAYTIIFLTCYRVTRNLRAAAFGALLAAALGLSDWNVRPQAITFLIGALFILAISELRQTRRREWLLVFPVGMIFWVNSHGSYVIGLVLVGTWMAIELWAFWQRRVATDLWLALIAFLSVILFCLFNPRGIDVLQYTSGMASNPVIQNMVAEWAAPTFDTLNGALFLSGFLVAVTVLMISPKRPSLFQLVLFLGFSVLGLKTLRGSIWFGLVLAPTIADHFSHLMAKLLPSLDTATNQSGSKLINGFVIAFFGLSAILSLPWFKNHLPYPPQKAGLISFETPTLATQELMESAYAQEVFHSMSFGSYLIWAAQPEYPVFVDSRIELYPAEIWRDYLLISAALTGWDDLLDQYQVNTLMLSPTDQSTLITAVEAHRQWERVYQDSAAEIFIRK